MSQHNRARRWRHARAAVGALASLAVVSGCTGKRDAARRAADSVMAAVRAESTNAAAVAARPLSPLWDVDRVSEKLVRAGVAPRRINPAPATPDFFAMATASAAFHVGRGGEVRVFIFADSLARRKATSALDQFTASPPGAPLAWPDTPILIGAQNLAAIILGGNAALKERVQLALEAGLPVK